MVKQAPPDRAFYESAVTPAERRKLAQPASLDEDQQLLRLCILRLLRNLPDEPSSRAELDRFRLIAQLVRAIAAVERLKQAEPRTGDPDEKLLEMLTTLDPYEDL
jgi:hypothetical protein